MRRTLPLTAIVTAVVIALALAAASTTRATAATSPPLAERQVYGGLCTDGACETTMVVRRNGHVELTEGPRRIRSIVLTARQRSRLITLVESTSVDPAKLPASTDCPPAYDGQATRYVLHRHVSTRVFDQCTVLVPNGGVFGELDRIWKKLSAA